MSSDIARVDASAIAEKVLIHGDLSKLTAAERLDYYSKVCESVGLNPLTKPFDYITLNGKLTLYAKRDCTDQLRHRDGVSVQIVSRESIDGVFIVTARATVGNRADESIGAVAIEGLKGDARANAIMKAETKAKRRVTLSICGLGLLDETEVDTVHDHHEPPKALPSSNGVNAGKIKPTSEKHFNEILLNIKKAILELPAEDLGDTPASLEDLHVGLYHVAPKSQELIRQKVREAWVMGWMPHLDPDTDFAEFGASIKGMGLRDDVTQRLLDELEMAQRKEEVPA